MNVHIEGADDVEHLRSPAALRVAELAAESELFFFHFEHRLELPLPESLGGIEEPRGFEAGILRESKYQAFRHDLLVASFNPTHRAKWTAHELCHVLVGFGHRSGATPFFHVLGAWLAELLPVALWYFFDESGLRRCARHAGQGPRFRAHCEDCEREARRGALETRDAKFVEEGRAFVDRELAAVARSRREGRVLGSRFATIDLASDAVAYVASHRARLESELFERFTSEHFSPGGGLHGDLDALEARVLEVMEGIVRGAAVRPLAGGRYERVAQDLAYRLLLVLEETEGDASRELDRLVSRLAGDRTEASVERVVADYEALAEDYVLPPPEDVFAVGYELPRGYGSGVAQLVSGLHSACPRALEALGDDLDAVVGEFVRRDPRIRRPLVHRFAEFLAGREPAASFARFEAAVCHAPRPSPERRAFAIAPSDGDALELAPDARLVRVAHDVEHEGDPADAPDRPRSYLVRAEDEGEVGVYALSERLADAIQDRDVAPVPAIAEELASLAEAGLFLPKRLAL